MQEKMHEVNETRHGENETGHGHLHTFNWSSLIKTNIFLILGILAFFGNLIVIGIILKYRNLSKKEDQSMYLIGFLAATDSLTGLGTIIAASTRLWIQIGRIMSFNKATCLSLAAPMVTGFYSSQVMIACVAIDRLIAVLDPIKYQAQDHWKFSYRCFLVTMLYALMSVGAMFVGVDFGQKPKMCNMAKSATPMYMKYFTVFSFTISFIIILLYLSVVVVLKMGMAAKSQQNSPSVQVIHLERQARVTKVISLILAIYCVFWVLPTSVFNTLIMVGKKGPFLGFFDHQFIAMGATASAAVNVFVYSYRMPAFRQYLKKFMKWQRENTVRATTRSTPGGTSKKERLFSSRNTNKVVPAKPQESVEMERF